MDIKICGLTNIDDAKAARDAGADFLGFVLYHRSPRYISGISLLRIAEELSGETRLIGVFVNEHPNEVAGIASDCGLYAVQLHGDETHREFFEIKTPLWRSVHMSHEGTPEPDPSEWPAERYVFDSFTPGIYGGTGVTADWECATSLARRFPVMLAGGLTSENVEAGIRIVKPTGVDAASGVESDPGKKDHNKIKAFIKAARSATRA